MGLPVETQAVLVSRGMAYFDAKGAFMLNRKGRRFLESQLGKAKVKALREEAQVLDTGRKTRAKVKDAWQNQKTLAQSEEKSQHQDSPV